MRCKNLNQHQNEAFVVISCACSTQVTVVKVPWIEKIPIRVIENYDGGDNCRLVIIELVNL